MAATKLFTYKIRNPKADITSSEVEHWISLGTCYQDDDEEESYPYFIFNDRRENDNNNFTIQQKIEPEIPQITGDSASHTYYTLSFQGGER